MGEQRPNTLSELDLDQLRQAGSLISLPNSDIIYLEAKNTKKAAMHKIGHQFSIYSLFNSKTKHHNDTVLFQTTKSELKEILAPFAKKSAKVLSYDTDDLYEKDFQSLKDNFSSNNEFKKCVLKSRQYYAKENIDPLSILSCLLESEKGLLYGHWDGDYGLMGMTPEILFQRNEDSFQTMALAGTRALSNKEELLTDKKEREEHQLVITDIENKLLPIQCHVGETKLLDYNKFAHLYTEISFKTELASNTVLNKLNPTAALGGYPSDLAQDFIRNSFYHKEYGETFFGGSLLFEYDQLVLALVNIRNVQWDKECVWIESGTGIVADSVLENELNEIGLKRKSIEELIFE